MSPNYRFQSNLLRSSFFPELREATCFLWSSNKETLFSWRRALFLKHNGVQRAALLELLNIDVSRDFFDLFYQHLFKITTGPTPLRFPFNLIVFNHFDGYLVQQVRHFFSSWSFIMMSGLLIEFDFFFGYNRHVPDDSTHFTFIFCYLSATLMLYSLLIFQRM